MDLAPIDEPILWTSDETRFHLRHEDNQCPQDPLMFEYPPFQIGRLRGRRPE